MGDMQSPDLHNVKSIMLLSQKLQGELQKMGLKIKHHEENLKFLKSQMNKVDESILDMQVTIGKYHTSNATEKERQTLVHLQTEQQTLEHILLLEKTAASIICKTMIHHGAQASKIPVTRDVLGVIATLGKIKDDNLSRLLSEYLGLETMLAIVCKTSEGVRALEEYDKAGMINKSAGLHGLGASIGRTSDGRFLVICLEDLRPYTGDFVVGDPQKRLALLKPRLPNGEPPAGFLGFAVNMIDLEDMYLSCVTRSGHGLRETLFHCLLSRVQVYRTRSNMQLALPYVSDGAISLDGGMVKGVGIFSLGDGKDVEVRFPVSSGVLNPAMPVYETQEQLQLANWHKERLAEDMQREEALLNHEKNLFSVKKQELLKYLTESARYTSQAQVQCPKNLN